jgi:hypothetical protein
MIKVLHGPTYEYQGERLTEPTTVVIQDHCFNELTQTFALQQLLDASVCDPRLHTLVFDHVLQQDEFTDYHCVYMPTLLAREAQEFVEQCISPLWTLKVKAFNFMINKPRPHRKLLLQLVDQHGLTSYSHSLCWKSSPVPSIAVTDRRISGEVQLDQGVKNGQYRNSTTYQALLQRQVFEPACVSLITEPVYYERQTIVTEKTLMAIWGGTLPVWVGGWRCASYMRDQGFDVFDDVVDHSYESLPDPEQRVRAAVELNLDLLQAPDADFASRYTSRLRHNLELARSNPWAVQCATIQHCLAI